MLTVKETAPQAIGVYLNLNRKRFEEGYNIVKATNVGVKMCEVLVRVNDEEFETTFDELEKAILRLRK